MIQSLIPFILFIIPMSITPGPNNFMLLNSGLHFGPRRSMPHFLGVCIGASLLILLTALGLGAVFTHLSWLKTILKYSGAAYMLYLAWTAIRASSSITKPGYQQQPISFWQAFNFQWINPKAWVMAIGATSLFSLSQHYFLTTFSLTGLYFFISLIAAAVWLWFGALISHILKNQRHRVIFNYFMALSLVLSAGLILLD